MEKTGSQKNIQDVQTVRRYRCKRFHMKKEHVKRRGKNIVNRGGTMKYKQKTREKFIK
jgi:hypothetical protein